MSLSETLNQHTCTGFCFTVAFMLKADTDWATTKIHELIGAKVEHLKREGRV